MAGINYELEKQIADKVSALSRKSETLVCSAGVQKETCDRFNEHVNGCNFCPKKEQLNNQMNREE